LYRQYVPLDVRNDPVERRSDQGSSARSDLLLMAERNRRGMHSRLTARFALTGLGRRMSL
jgi:hypothetical protein